MHFLSNFLLPFDISTGIMADNVAELHKEWRSIVLSKLDTLEHGQKDVMTEIGYIKTSFAKQQTLEAMRVSYQYEIDKLIAKVEKLEAFKAKAIGAMIAFQFATGLAIAWFVK